MQWSFTVRELGHVRHVLAYRRMGLVGGPLLFKVTMSENHAWGVSPSPEGLRMFTEAIIPDDVDYRWMTYVEGDCHADLCRYAVENGGHVRTGVGDNPLFEGEALTNAGQIERVVAMASAAGRGIASPAETRELLGRPPVP
jgi:3-keto-5-aminohexanoate cleavage enzyme